jgi:DNA (cytosine-5)-methyltransferase 1
MPDVPLKPDITDQRRVKSLPQCEIVTAGFPCQDLSQAGRKMGIDGSQSSLVSHIYRLLSKRGHKKPNWLIIENVPYMLRLDRGKAMSYLVEMIESLGYRWAYRVIDARSLGVPQRRPRVVMVASLNDDPRAVLFNQDSSKPFQDPKPSEIDEERLYGFYWTEGSRGVGWALEAVPPVKGGSTLGIPSPPAIWSPTTNFVGTPSIVDAERLQGFPAKWTEPALEEGAKREGPRWRLVGNAVCVNVASWLAEQIISYDDSYTEANELIPAGRPWPKAAWGANGSAYKVTASAWPKHYRKRSLRRFLKDPLKPLSERATKGFLKRASICTNVVYSPRFISSLEKHVESL